MKVVIGSFHEILLSCFKAIVLSHALQSVSLRLSSHSCKQFVKKIQQDATMYQNFIIPYLYEAKHVSGTHRP
jgi:hypothetical protein